VEFEAAVVWRRFRASFSTSLLCCVLCQDCSAFRRPSAACTCRYCRARSSGSMQGSRLLLRQAPTRVCSLKCAVNCARVYHMCVCVSLVALCVLYQLCANLIHWFTSAGARGVARFCLHPVSWCSTVMVALRRKCHRIKLCATCKCI
jgi:hypothetical protein